MTEFEKIWDASSSSNSYFTDKALEVQRGGNNVFNAMEQMPLNSHLLTLHPIFTLQHAYCVTWRRISLSSPLCFSFSLSPSLLSCLSLLTIFLPLLLFSPSPSPCLFHFPLSLFIHQPTYLFNNYLLSTYYESGIGLGTRDSDGALASKILQSSRAHARVRKSFLMKSYPHWDLRDRRQSVTEWGEVWYSRQRT